eukprot:gene6720-13614_t
MSLRLNLDANENKGDVPLIIALSSKTFQFCVVGCIGATIPILFDFTIDSFVSSTRHLHLAKTAVWMLILSSFGK